jgi:hypothetical protein
MRLPNYKGFVYDRRDSLLDSVDLKTRFGIYGNSATTFFGTFDDQLLLGGVVYKPWVDWDYQEISVDSVVIVKGPGGRPPYPRDSLKVLVTAAVMGGPNFYCTWQWRGSDYEIRWKDTLTNSLTAQVWDLDNDVEVPLEAGVTKANMVQSSWCFNPLTTAGGAQVDSGTSTNTYGMHVAGVAVYFNRAGLTLRRMTTLWPMRPETGDVWRVYCSGPKPPHQGGRATIILSPAVVGVAGEPGAFAPDLMLEQNLPNPFRQMTTINYQLTKPGLVSLKVYNVAGQMVRTVVGSAMPAGRHSATWDGRDEGGRRIAAGVYLYQLQAGDRALTRKMVLVK